MTLTTGVSNTGVQFCRSCVQTRGVSKMGVSSTIVSSTTLSVPECRQATGGVSNTGVASRTVVLSAPSGDAGVQPKASADTSILRLPTCPILPSASSVSLESEGVEAGEGILVGLEEKGCAGVLEDIL